MRGHALARRAALAGHELALHGFSHRRHADLIPPDARDELPRGVGAFEAVTGSKPRFFRPPYGRFSEHSYKACDAMDLQPVYWSAWGLDWYDLPAAEVADLVVPRPRAGRRSSCCTTRRATRPRESAAPVAEAIPLIAAAAAERGLEWMTLGQAAGPALTVRPPSICPESSIAVSCPRYGVSAPTPDGGIAIRSIPGSRSAAATASPPIAELGEQDVRPASCIPGMDANDRHSTRARSRALIAAACSRASAWPRSRRTPASVSVVTGSTRSSTTGSTTGSS